MVNSEVSGYYKMSMAERREILQKECNLTNEEILLLEKSFGAMPEDQADRQIENVVGLMPVPIGVATNFRVDGQDYFVPMAIEEASVVAAASNSAKVTREAGGFFCSDTGSIMIGQIQTVNVNDPNTARLRVLENKERIVDLANKQDPILVKFGGGCRDIRARVVSTNLGDMLIAELLVDVRDAMGANAVNTMAEACAPLIEEITGGKVFLRIISNLADLRLVRARAIFPKENLTTKDMSGEEVVEGILKAYHFAKEDPYRAATHNKGIMNGISAVALALAQDTRAIEAGAHTYASRIGKYTSLTSYEKDSNGDLVGTIELPIAVGTVGGVAGIHPIAKVTKKILGVTTAIELARVMAAVGLAQNFGALRALATVGIQRGHMKLHAQNIAAAVGATGEMVDKLAQRLIAEGKVTPSRARELFEEMKK
ncbi:MAG: hydroxymethylglutaryl-CoA reductase, degradative [Candidatus Hermodarchaeota archaeon]